MPSRSFRALTALCVLSLGACAARPLAPSSVTHQASSCTVGAPVTLYTSFSIDLVAVGASASGVGVIFQAQEIDDDPYAFTTFLAPPGSDGLPSTPISTALLLSSDSPNSVAFTDPVVIDQGGFAIMTQSQQAVGDMGGSVEGPQLLSLFDWTGASRTSFNLTSVDDEPGTLFGGAGILAAMPTALSTPGACALFAFDESGTSQGSVALPFGQSLNVCTGIQTGNVALVAQASGGGFVGAFRDANDTTLDFMLMSAINAPATPLARLPLGREPVWFDVARDPTSQRTVAVWSINTAPQNAPPLYELDTGGPSLPTLQLATGLSQSEQSALIAANSFATVVLYEEEQPSNAARMVILDTNGAVLKSQKLADDPNDCGSPSPVQLGVVPLGSAFVVVWVDTNDDTGTDTLLTSRISCGS